MIIRTNQVKIHFNLLSPLLIIWLLLPSLACGQNDPEVPIAPQLSSTFSEPVNRGTVNNPTISEASGIVASRSNSDILWTHNDSGNDAKIYAINTLGETVGEWIIAGATN